MCHVFFVLNHTYDATIESMPLNASTGSACDMSPLLCFHFWKPVFFIAEDALFPSNSPEERGCFVGTSEKLFMT